MFNFFLMLVALDLIEKGKERVLSYDIKLGAFTVSTTWLCCYAVPTP